MHQRLVTRLIAATSRDKRAFLSPLIVGLGIWIGFPTVSAYQDMPSLVSGLGSPDARWSSFVEKSAAGSVQNAEMPFVDSDLTTAAISGSGVTAPGLGTVSFRGKGLGAGQSPDEDRVVRSGKMDRIINVAPVAPPRPFDAGSMFKRTGSLLLHPAASGEIRTAFAMPDIRGKEIEIAMAFYPKHYQPAGFGVPPILADLVTNEQADILATAYAPATPDYAKASPFQSLLEEERPGSGRFIPPLAKGDHAWMSNPLPATVFSAKEQKCLATGIYFEARGENLRGQAAVGQVILNRVRNPTYPNTICGVVYQNDDWRNRCQFSFACDGKKDSISSPRSYKIAEEIAMAVTAGKIFLPEIGSSTHYYATYVSPSWARSMEKMKKIGLHIFYRTKGGGWS